MFPILDEEMIELFEDEATAGEREEFEKLFGIEDTIRPTLARQDEKDPGGGPYPREIVSITLFWKHVGLADPDLPPPTRDLLVNTERYGLNKRFSPWESYIEPMLTSMREARDLYPEVTFRVHLAADLDFLIPELVEQGWEVNLMKSPSIRYCPGGFWRFLALEEDALVTIIDADRVPEVCPEIERTRAMHQLGLGLWRVPGYYNSDLNHYVRYRPILGGHFGARGGEPVRRLIEAFLWHTRRDSMDNTVMVPGIGERPILFAQWPGYGFDEWFQLAALYPRLVRKGTLTFIPHDARSALLPADIDYAAWAHPGSEIAYV